MCRLFRRLRLQLALLTLVAALGYVLLLAYRQQLAVDSNEKRITSLLWPWSTAQGSCTPMVLPEENANTDIDTAEMYPHLDFTPQYGTFWNKTFEDRYMKIRGKWKDLPLKVIVVPHSHADPGWLQTYDGYYNFYISRILENMVTFLNRTTEFRFIWSEISFFSKWWNKINKDQQATVKNLIERGQLEIVTGGWVMTDEAAAHYFSMIDQLIEGHQWLRSSMSVSPNHGWSVDIFGHSSTMPFILWSSGIADMVILRIHYAWKAFLANKRRLDFYWKQDFGSSSMLCHMAPSDLYSIKHTCGPDHQTCLQFDFRKIDGEYSDSTAVDISEENVAPKAELLLGQYGRFASLYPHNVILVPLGDDFRYNHYKEWEQQYQNYEKLFRYINKRKDWNAHVQFGTVRDYFEEVSKRLKSMPYDTLPVLRGDFFPYADTYADIMPSYWTGYYTTRPFWKHLTRELEHWLRAAEILYSMVHTTLNGEPHRKLLSDYTYLTSARQNLALFQHHDAITGTSKSEVMKDYGQRLHASIKEAMGIVSHASQFLTLPDKGLHETFTSVLFPDVERPDAFRLTQKVRLSIPKNGRKIILFNSLTYRRQEPIKLHVKTPYVKVLNPKGYEVTSQINPVWNESLRIADNRFQLVFICDVAPLAFVTYTLMPVGESDLEAKTEVSVFVDDGSQDHLHHSAFTFNNHKMKEIIIKSPLLTAKFSQTGLLKQVYLREEGVLQDVQVDFSIYKSMQYRSGGYLFHPQQNDPVAFKNITGHFPVVYVVKGPIMSEVSYIQSPVLSLTTRVYHSSGPLRALELETTIDLTKTNADTELVMEIKSSIDNKDVFYTDANGFKMVKRKYASRLPVQGNYYPMTSAAYVEDSQSRITVLTSHSHGVTSPKSGFLEIMLDRRIQEDDSRGMGEGVLDNKLIVTSFWLLPEVVSGKSNALPSLSSTAHRLSVSMLYPTISLVVDGFDPESVPESVSLFQSSWPTDIHLVNLRTLPSETDFSLPSNNSLMVLHRKGVSCNVDSHEDTSLNESGKLTVSFPHLVINSVHRTSLTGLHVLEKLNHTFILQVKPMTLEAYNINFR